jgi:hypothetical protein
MFFACRRRYAKINKFLVFLYLCCCLRRGLLLQKKKRFVICLDGIVTFYSTTFSVMARESKSGATKERRTRIRSFEDTVLAKMVHMEECMKSALVPVSATGTAARAAAVKGTAAPGTRIAATAATGTAPGTRIAATAATATAATATAATGTAVTATAATATAATATAATGTAVTGTAATGTAVTGTAVTSTATTATATTATAATGTATTGTAATGTAATATAATATAATATAVPAFCLKPISVDGVASSVATVFPESKDSVEAAVVLDAKLLRRKMRILKRCNRALQEILNGSKKSRVEGQPVVHGPDSSSQCL